MRDSYNAISQRGGAVAVVGQGEPRELASLRDRHGIPFRCLADPARDSYRAFGLRRGGFADVAGPQVLLKSALSALRGNIGLPGGDVFQLTGTFVIGTDGNVRFAFRGKDPSDLPPMDAILSAL